MECSCIAFNKSTTNSGWSSKLVRRGMLVNELQTSFAAFVGVSPRNCLTNSRRVKSRLPRFVAAICEKTRRCKAAESYHQGEVKSVGRNFRQSSGNCIVGW